MIELPSGKVQCILGEGGGRGRGSDWRDSEAGALSTGMRVTTGKKSEKFPGRWRTARPPSDQGTKPLAVG